MVKKKIFRAGRAGAPRTPQSEDYIWDGLALTAFGERLDNEDDSSSAIRSLGEGWFTGKPHVAGLGHAFLFRNYRAGLAKWQTADPMGYPDGWNQLAYCGNEVFERVDYLGGLAILCHDLHDYNAVKSGALWLNVVVGGMRSEFTYSLQSFEDVDGELTIHLLIGVSVGYFAHDSDFYAGDVTEYKPHANAPNDSEVRNGVHEAVVAHEVGHASSFFGYFLPVFRNLLYQYVIPHYGMLTDIERSRWIGNYYNSAINSWLPYSYAAANGATYGWFVNNATWHYMGKEAGFDRWVKE